MEKIVQVNPTSPGLRGKVKITNKRLYKGRPIKSLCKKKIQISGRNSEGKITVRHRGGGHKKHYRKIEWNRSRDGILAKVVRIEYDPNRSANIALLSYSNGEFSYIVSPNGIKIGDMLTSGIKSSIKVGNCLPLSIIPLGTTIHCIELKPKKGAQLARSAGTSAQLLAREGRYVTVRLKSGEMRKIFMHCRATIGEVGNNKHNLIKFGKAGAKRHLGIRPSVRGVAMNPIDHPLGGGEGKTSGGRPSCDPWGNPKGKRTRKNKNTDKYIVRTRHKNKERRGK
jgi:large subunit ribosomal protein L2